VHAVERPGGPVLPHRREIRDRRDVQIYEALMEDHERPVTFRLLRGRGRPIKHGADSARLADRGWRRIGAHCQSDRAGPGFDRRIGSG